MAASTAQAPSKSSKKKAAKPIERTQSPSPSTASGPADKNGDDTFESPYIRELQKNIRNLNKKIGNAAKLDALLAQHAGKSVDQLVDEKVINNDQKAQILKKPALQTQLAQTEEQLAQYQKVDEQYRTQAAADKAESEKTLRQATQKASADAQADAKANFEKTQRSNLLLVSQFLRLAAYRREEATDPESDESQAIEGVLLAIYTGDDSAVNAMLKLVEGSNDQILSVPGEQLQTTYSQVKSLAQDYKSPYDAEESAREASTDPTVAHATAGEIEAGDATAMNSSTAPATESLVSSFGNVQLADNTAANAAAGGSVENPNESSLSQEWVQVPSEPSEADPGASTPAATTAAAASNSQSWADDHPEPQAETQTVASTAPADSNDGFHQVQRNRGRNEREGGNQRGRGRGDWRGRGGQRGDGRGRGRGNRNAGGAARGARRNEES